jgi:hypothetical protein
MNTQSESCSEKTECPCDQCEDYCPTPLDCEKYLRWAYGEENAALRKVWG